MLFVIFRHKMYRWIYVQQSAGVREKPKTIGPVIIVHNLAEGVGGGGGMAGAAQQRATINFSYCSNYEYKR